MTGDCFDTTGACLCYSGYCSTTRAPFCFSFVSKRLHPYSNGHIIFLSYIYYSYKLLNSPLTSHFDLKLIIIQKAIILWVSKANLIWAIIFHIFWSNTYNSRSEHSSCILWKHFDRVVLHWCKSPKTLFILVEEGYLFVSSKMHLCKKYSEKNYTLYDGLIFTRKKIE